MTDIRCLFGRHDLALAEHCSHLRHCSRCDRAYTGLAKAWSAERRAKGRPWVREWLRAHVLNDPTWECRPGNVWRALAWTKDFGE